LLLSVLFRIFGTGASGALAVNILGASAAALAFALLPGLAVAGGLDLLTGVMAGMAGALFPVNYWPQTSGVFDAPLTCLVLLSLCYLLCRTLRADRFSRADAVVFGLAAGIGCLVNPGVIPVVAAWCVVCAWRFRSQLRRVLGFFAVAAACILLVLTPWAIRNHSVLGSTIWTRSNLGLELQVSNNDVMTPDLEHNVRVPEFGLLHPFAGAGERAKVKAMGEVAYQHSKMKQALSWIAANKLRFLDLTAQRFRLFWLPEMRRNWQSAIEDALTLCGLVGLAFLFRRGNALSWLAGAVLAAYPFVHYLIQVTPRYRLPIEPFLFLLSAHLVAVAVRSGLPHKRESISIAPRGVRMPAGNAGTDLVVDDWPDSIA
jgi:hypothetical protein